VNPLIASIIGGMAGLLISWALGLYSTHPRLTPRQRRRGSNPPPPWRKPEPSRNPPAQPLAADLIRYSQWCDEQVRRALNGEDPQR
jgi:hypothetical protein